MDSAPKPVKEGVSKEEAEEIQKEIGRRWRKSRDQVRSLDGSECSHAYAKYRFLNVLILKGQAW